MKAIILAVGSELLTPSRMDTNSLYLTARLNELGVEVIEKRVIGDNRERLTRAALQAAHDAEILLFTGGLGPTEDDLTREAVAAAFQRELVFRQELKDELERIFATFKRKMTENNVRQAFLIEDAEALPNPHGTAPGQFFTDKGRAVALLPGPPRELQPMWEEQVAPRLRKILPARVMRTRELRVAGMGESDLDNLIAPVYSKFTNPVTTVLAAIGDIQVHFLASGETEEECQKLLAEVSGPVEELLGDRIYSTSAETLEEVVGKLLKGKKQAVTTAESCTGGMLATRITDVPGSSSWFRGGFVPYSSELKTAVLGIDPELIREHGAVSEPVARAMAEAARERAGADWGVSITGVAGPDGGTEETPVGTIFLGLAAPSGTQVRRLDYARDRARVRFMATQTALDWLRRSLLTE